MTSVDAQTGYAPVRDLNMYYEIHGSGRPLVLLHGAYMTIDMMGPLLPGLAEIRQVIAVEGDRVSGATDAPDVRRHAASPYSSWRFHHW
jgi:pimeloyl-ACP methyl ester carboxylesterase